MAKSISKQPSKVAREAAAEKARKQASKAALHAAIDPTPPTPASPVVDPVVVQTQRTERAKQDAANAISMAKADEEMLAEMGIDAQGFPLVEEKQRYTGPMLALVAARKHYVKAANGILCNGDQMATALGSLNRAQVVQVLVAALKLPGNPYAGMNPGQQSMNLRNRARHAVTKGTLTMAEVIAAVERCSRHPEQTA